MRGEARGKQPPASFLRLSWLHHPSIRRKEPRALMKFEFLRHSGALKLRVESPNYIEMVFPIS